MYDKLCQNESEISKCVSLAKAKSRRIISKNGNILIITDFQSSLQIANIVSSQLRGSHKNGIYLAIRRGDVNSQFEVRLGHRVEGVDLVALITEISKEVDLLNHGGHMRAAGGGLLSVNLEMFIDSAIRILAE